MKITPDSVGLTGAGVEVSRGESAIFVSGVKVFSRKLQITLPKAAQKFY